MQDQQAKEMFHEIEDSDALSFHAWDGYVVFAESLAKAYQGCSQNYGSLRLIEYITTPILGVPKWDPNCGNYPYSRQGMSETTLHEGRDARQCLADFPADPTSTPVVPFCPFHLGAYLLKLNSRKKGTLIIDRLLGNLAKTGANFIVNMIALDAYDTVVLTFALPCVKHEAPHLDTFPPIWFYFSDIWELPQIGGPPVRPKILQSLS